MGRLLALALLLVFAVSALWSLARRDGAAARAAPAESAAAEVPEEPRVEIASAPAVSVESAPARTAAEPSARALVERREAGRANRADLAGRVVRPDRSPVAGAEVRLESDGPFRSKLAPLASTETKPDGSFELASRHAGPFRVQALERRDKRTVSEAALEGVVRGRADIELVLPAACALRGRVVDDRGQPVPEFYVSCEPSIPSREVAPFGQRFSSPSGDFAFDSLSPGDWVLSVTARDLVRARRQVTWELSAPLDLAVRARRQVTLPAAAPLTVVLAHKAIVRGVVLDPAGNPLDSASIESSASAGAWSHDGGRFLLRLEAGPELEIWAHHEGFAPSEHVQLALEPGQELDALELRLRALPRVTGEALGPLAVQEQTVRVHGTIDLGRALSDVCVSAADVGGKHGWLDVRVHEGSYEAVLPGPGTYKFLVDADRLVLQPIVDVPEAEDYRFDLSFSLARLSGRVRDETGAPLAGVLIDANSDGNEPAFPCSGHATTDARGEFALELVPGTYRVFPRVDVERERSLLEAEARVVTLPVSAGLAGVDFELRAGAALTGIVRCADGRPADRTWVSVVGGEEESERSQETDEEGRFRFQSLVGGRYWLSAVRGDDPIAEPASTTAEPLLVELAPGAAQSIELRLVPSTRVRVRLSDASGALVDAELEAVDALGRAVAAREIESGVRGFLLVPPGPYTLRALREKHLFEQPLSLAGGASELEVEFRLE